MNMLDYKDIYSTYEKMLDEKIEYAKQKNKKDLEKNMEGWSSEKPSEVLSKQETLANMYGEKLYSELTEMVEEKENELKRLLKNKGIEW